MNLMGSEVADIAAIESMKSFITANPTCVNPPRPTGWLAGTGGGARAQGLNPMSRGCELHALDLVSATEACCTLMWPAYRAGPPRPRSHAQPLCILWLRVPPVHVWLHVLEVCRPRAWTCAGGRRRARDLISVRAFVFARVAVVRARVQARQVDG